MYHLHYDFSNYDIFAETTILKYNINTTNYTVSFESNGINEIQLFTFFLSASIIRKILFLHKPF